MSNVRSNTHAPPSQAAHGGSRPHKKTYNSFQQMRGQLNVGRTVYMNLLCFDKRDVTRKRIPENSAKASGNDLAKPAGQGQVQPPVAHEGATDSSPIQDQNLSVQPTSTTISPPKPPTPTPQTTPSVAAKVVQEDHSIIKSQTEKTTTATSSIDRQRTWAAIAALAPPSPQKRQSKGSTTQRQGPTNVGITMGAASSSSNLSQSESMSLEVSSLQDQNAAKRLSKSGKERATAVPSPELTEA
ncbi:hypothetical protein GSI_11094 [Ganoderma sinense ZZ0214-1]|uniref:Uncharacterized protein n=1 Tax=Ganoderma sinense ZZ0214-1 TaxID=1077348 RepID=A0A2G8RZ85_9APHY|nr:hypothetical protein GSI_11094 [Ganoderma sinense ZZ0214-1]